jgi:glycosyltransferase involved in cell wall biosynthesis
LFASLLRTYERADAVLTLSPHTTEFLRRYVPGARPVTLGAGVTLRGDRRLSVADFRSRYQLGGGRLILYVGRKEHSKRYELAVEAVEKLHGTALLVVVGRDVDRKPIHSEHVRYLGTLPDDELAAAYAACDIFVLPSVFESFGMVFLDAWSHGKPVIGNRICGAAASLIDDGVDGFLCGDAGEIAMAMRRLLEDRELAGRLGAAGRAKVHAEYTWEHVATRALDALRGLTEARPAGTLTDPAVAIGTGAET